jgi:hypothetical protein
MSTASSAANPYKTMMEQLWLLDELWAYKWDVSDIVDVGGSQNESTVVDWLNFNNNAIQPNDTVVTANSPMWPWFNMTL